MSDTEGSGSSNREWARVRRALALVALLSVALLLGLLSLFDGPSRWFARMISSAPPSVSASVADAAVPIASPVAVDAGVVDASTEQLQHMTEAERQAWFQHMEEVRSALLEKTKYPPNSLPLAGKPEMMDPHHVETTHRPLMVDADGGAGNIVITQAQSQIWLSDGEVASAYLTVQNVVTKTKPNVEFISSILSRPIPKTDRPGTALATVIFHDDGVPPDLMANDSVYSAAVPPDPSVLKGTTTDLLLDIEMLADGERGQFRYHFTTTGPVPGQFTGAISDAIEQGSLAFHVGIDVYTSARFSIMGRLYDGTGKPAALLTFLQDLTVDSHEVVLTAFGKVLRDQGMVPPFTLRNLEGFAYVQTEDSDREVMTVWPGPYTTETFDISQLSDAEWDSPAKSKKVDTVSSMIEHGPSEIAPVDSNGIPLPPMPLVLPSAPPGTPTAVTVPTAPTAPTATAGK